MKTNETQWTKGPWMTPGTDGGVICADVLGSRRTIAHVYAPYSDHDESGEERDSNARLIAAAPEMAELLAELTLDLTVPIMARGKCALLLAKIKGADHA